MAVFAGGVRELLSSSCLVCVSNVSGCDGENFVAAAVVATLKGSEAGAPCVCGLVRFVHFGPSPLSQIYGCYNYCLCFGQMKAKTVVSRQAVNDQHCRIVMKLFGCHSGDCCCLKTTGARCVPGACYDTVLMSVCVQPCETQL